VSRRRIAVLTGSRAEYGLLYWTMKEIAAEPSLALQLIVTGSHLEKKFGMSVRQIEADGFSVDAAVPMNLGSSASVDIARALGEGVSGVARALDALRPDILLLLGDRYEVHAAATAAMIMRVPIAHLHGGETTEGAIDEAIRHAVTKMAHLHFVAAPQHRHRVLQLGESPDRVFVVGAAGLDNIARLDLLDRGSLEKTLGHELAEGYLMVTYHPVTLQPGGSAAAVAELLAALDEFAERSLIITGTNADPDGDPVRAALGDYAARHRGRVHLHETLGTLAYLSALKHAAAVVGNSSSGLLEAPSLGVPTVNVGDRQRGRLRAGSVLDAAEERSAIAAALRTALSPAFRAAIDPSRSPYGQPGAAKRIAVALRDLPLDGILLKRFRDLPRGG
jgi:UDP-hydrolysing UDP-N-acetyl-D-glucosamine 2-epimerase